VSSSGFIRLSPVSLTKSILCDMLKHSTSSGPFLFRTGRKPKE